MTKKPAFSLMEVMVILLIMAVTLAATAPMISKKMSRNVGTAEEPWKFSGSNQSISFNGNNRDNSTVFIGTDRRGGRLSNVRQADNIPLYIRAGGDRAAISFTIEHKIEDPQDADFGKTIIMNQDYSIANLSDAERDAYNYQDNPRNYRIYDNRILSYLGMANFDGVGYPFFSGVIPSSAGLILGNRMKMSYADDNNQANPNLNGDNITGKCVLGYDNAFNERRDNNQTAIQQQNINIIGSDISAMGAQNSIILGRGFQASFSYFHPIRNCVILNASYPHWINPTWVNENDDVPAHMSWDFQDGANINHNTILNASFFDNDNIDGTTTGNDTVIGCGSTAVGSNHTILGHELFCGTTWHLSNRPSDMGEHNVDSSIAIGSNSGAMGDNSISIGFQNTAGQQGRDQVNAPNNQVAFSAQNPLYNSIAIGDFATATAAKAIAGGHGASSGTLGIAIGNQAIARSDNSIRIGARGGVNQSNDGAVRGNNSIGLGTRTQVHSNNSVAIGNGAVARNDNEIVLGRASGSGIKGHTVVVPGTLSANNIVLSGIAKDQIKSSNFYNDLMNYHRSDIRLKNVGEKFTSGLEDIKKLNFFNYTYKNDKEKNPHVGVMAQDLQKVFPISVSEGSDGYLRIRLDEMFYAALNAIKELDQKIIALAGEVKEFFSRVDKLELRVAQHQTSLEDLKAESADIEARLSRLEK